MQRTSQEESERLMLNTDGHVRARRIFKVFKITDVKIDILEILIAEPNTCQVLISSDSSHTL